MRFVQFLFFKHTLERVALTVFCVTVSQFPDNVKFLSNFVLLDIF